MYRLRYSNLNLLSILLITVVWLSIALIGIPLTIIYLMNSLFGTHIAYTFINCLFMVLLKIFMNSKFTFSYGEK